MTYRVIDRKTKKDITNDYLWVITPEGTLYYREYSDLTGYPDADIVFRIGGTTFIENH